MEKLQGPHRACTHTTVPRRAPRCWGSPTTRTRRRMSTGARGGARTVGPARRRRRRTRGGLWRGDPGRSSCAGTAPTSTPSIDWYEILWHWHLTCRFSYNCLLFDGDKAGLRLPVLYTALESPEICQTCSR
uniref:Uncharacterized protein n=1 Tax=Aegilops tauschii subsp. strangulata TaxID=200361 RepID=A0A452Y932_AEGTS